VLGFLVAERIFRKRPNLDEGAMTNLRANLVNRGRLAAEAERIGLGPALLLGRGEESSGGREKASVLSDAFEAVVGAVFLDGGVRPVRSLVGRLFGGEVDKAPASGAPASDPKTTLQEWAQARGWGLPRYRLVSSAGPDHAREFVVEVVVGGQPAGRGPGRSKRRAEQTAAREALAHLAPTSRDSGSGI
jgi:ribonuclease-3